MIYSDLQQNAEIRVIFFGETQNTIIRDVNI